MSGPRVNSPSGGARYSRTGTPGHSRTETEPREGNARLTAGTAVVLFKLGSVRWRFARSSLGDAEYRRKGPPPVPNTTHVLGTGKTP